MQSAAKNPQAYLAELPEERKEVITQLRQVILANLPKEMTEEMSYGMLGYVVPHSVYPAGYHCDPKLPLPFMALASQKNFIAFYHMGMYTMPEIMTWFVAEYPKYCSNKLDMGKSCVRFKNMKQIPYDLIAELVRKIEVREWISYYEENIKR